MGKDLKGEIKKAIKEIMTKIKKKNLSVILISCDNDGSTELYREIGYLLTKRGDKINCTYDENTNFYYIEIGKKLLK